MCAYNVKIQMSGSYTDWGDRSWSGNIWHAENADHVMSRFCPPAAPTRILLRNVETIDLDLIPCTRLRSSVGGEGQMEGA